MKTILFFKVLGVLHAKDVRDYVPEESSDFDYLQSTKVKVRDFYIFAVNHLCRKNLKIEDF
jgi:hypothetical protein